MSQKIRLATPADSEAILRVYAPYISETAITFETEVPDTASFTRRVTAIAARYPFLVYESDGRVEGYAYAASYKERHAYRFDVELSIYLVDGMQGKGVAKALYDCLFLLLEELGYVNAYATCTIPNERSLRFHEREGFKLLCVHDKTGYKFGRWWDVAWFEKSIRDHVDFPEDPMPVGSLPADFIAEVLGRFPSSSAS